MMKEHSWLEVSMVVSGELAEAVAEVFSRYAPGGVAVESTGIKASADEFGEVTGPMRVRAYLPVDGQLEEARNKLEQALYFLGRIEPLPEPEFNLIQDQNWMEAWKQHYRPIEIGEQLLVLPAWAEMPNTDRIPVRIDPGMAFGTGTHPTTQLSLMLLEKYLQSGDVVLDIGAGTGILSITSRLLSASAAYGVDIEEESVLMARNTARENQVLENIQFEIGTVTDIQSGIFPINQAPVVIANILTHILIRLLDDGMGELVSPGGVLLLSGILEEKFADIQAALEKHNLKIIEKLMVADWVGLAVRNV
jgi:ribosomal protein L11 methyltransferase